MHDERILKAFELIHEAWALLYEVKNDTDNYPIQYICMKSMTLLADAGRAIAALVSKEG